MSTPSVSRNVSHLVILCILLCAQIVHTYDDDDGSERAIKRRKRLNFELDIRRGCSAIGFPNATLNDCGYCVGADTGLPADHGKDCAGVCGGQMFRDCKGVCGGRAYIDECTGKCLSIDKLTSAMVNATTNRDCRGLCLQPFEDLGSGAPASVQTYKIDQCGICRLSNSAGGDSASSSSSSASPTNFASTSFDCNNNCQLPGLVKSSLVCKQCVRSHELYHVVDDCGNCLSEGHFCSCDR